MIDKENLKSNFIYNIEKYCKVMKKEAPELTMDMTVDEIIDKGNGVKKDFWTIVNDENSKISKKDLIHNLQQEYSYIIKAFSGEVKSLNVEYYKNAKEECSKNIGKCFIREAKDRTIYSMIVAIDTNGLSLAGDVMFNEYQYTAISFELPYKGLLNPIKEVRFFYNMQSPMFVDTEITRNDFDKNLKELNEKWKDKIFSGDKIDFKPTKRDFL